MPEVILLYSGSARMHNKCFKCNIRVIRDTQQCHVIHVKLKFPFSRCKRSQTVRDNRYILYRSAIYITSRLSRNIHLEKQSLSRASIISFYLIIFEDRLIKRGHARCSSPVRRLFLLHIIIFIPFRYLSSPASV